MAKDITRRIRILGSSVLLLAAVIISLLWGLEQYEAPLAFLLLGSCVGFLPGVLRPLTGKYSLPWQGWRLVTACAIPIVTVFVVAVPWLIPEEFEEVKLDLKWPNVVACVAMLPLTVVCVLIRHPPSSYVRDSLRAVVSIWILLLTWSLNFVAKTLGRDPESSWKLVYQFMRGFGLHFEGVVVFMWISSLMVRRRSELEEQPTCASKYSRSLLGAMAAAFHSQAFLTLYMKTLEPRQEVETVVLFLICAVLFLTIWTAYTVLAAKVICQNIAMLQAEMKRVRGAPRAESVWAAHTLGFDLTACLILGLTTTLFWGFVVVRKFYAWFDGGDILGLEAAILHRLDLIINGLSVAVLSNLLWLPGKPHMDRRRLRSQVTLPCINSAGDREVWLYKVEDLSGRGVVLRDLIDFWSRLLNHQVMPSFNPERSTTNDVVRQAIIPMSRDDGGGGGRALASVWSNDEPMLPTRMVTHNWSNVFMHLLAGIVADALGEKCYENVARQLLSDSRVAEVRRAAESRGTLNAVYWVCAFSINQHAGICGGFGEPPELGTRQREEWERGRRDSVTQEPYVPCDCLQEKMFNDMPDLCEMNKFDDMMRLLKRKVKGFRHLVVVDEQFQVFQRAWCVAELVEASLSHIQQFIQIHSRDALDRHYESLSSLDVRDCQASRKEDKEMILANIRDTVAFNSHLQWAIFGTESLFTTWVDGQHQAALIGRILRRVRSARSRSTLSLASNGEVEQV